jgi:hypothetical protein
VGQGIENFFRFFENREKRLRAFAQQLFHTNVLNKCMIQVYYPTNAIGIRHGIIFRFLFRIVELNMGVLFRGRFQYNDTIRRIGCAARRLI